MVTRVFLDESLTPSLTDYDSRESASFDTQVGDVIVVCAGIYSLSTPTATHYDNNANSSLTGLTATFSDRFVSRVFYKVVTTARSGDTVTVTSGNSGDTNIAFAVKVLLYRPASGATLSYAAEHTGFKDFGASDPIVSSSFSTSKGGVVASFISTDAYTGTPTLTIPSSFSSVGTQYGNTWQAEYFNSSALTSATVSWSSTESPYYRRAIVGIALDEFGAPNPPTGVTAGSVTAYAVTASWTDASSDETGFKVQYAPSPYSSWTAFSGSPAAANATTLASGNVLTPGTSYKIRVASTNAAGDSAYVESGVFTTTPLTFLRPIADTSNGAWTASSGSDRYAMIDESSTNDADYITVSTASTYKTRLTTVSDPGVDTDHSVVVRAKGDGSSQLTIALVQGDPTETAIASTTVTPTVGYANYTLTVTSGQAANITDYSLLYLKLTSL